MRIVINEWDNNKYEADLVDIEEEDYPVGWGQTQEEAVARLFIEIIKNLSSLKNRINVDELEIDYA